MQCVVPLNRFRLRIPPGVEVLAGRILVQVNSEGEREARDRATLSAPPLQSLWRCRTSKVAH